MKATATRAYASPREKAAKTTGSQSKDVRFCAVCAVSRSCRHDKIHDKILRPASAQSRKVHARGRLRKVSHEILVVKDGRRYFVTNDAGRSAREVRWLYRHRQQIEEVFRLLKQEFGWGGASAQKMQAQRAHLHLGLYALCLAERAAMLQGQTIYAFKRRLFCLPIPEHLPQSEDLPLAA